MTSTVLLIEDAPDIRLAVRSVLGRAGMSVVEAEDGRSGLRALFSTQPSLVILDIGLPDLDGWEVLERIRDVTEVPVLILSARGLETDKVRGLRAGADDYITKPYGNQELLARVEALMRRADQRSETVDESFADGFLAIDHQSGSVWVHDELIELTPIELRLLAALTRRPGVVSTPQQLLDTAWGDPTGSGVDRVKYAVLRVRRKLAEAGGEEAAAALETVRGFGYRYMRPAD